MPDPLPVDDARPPDAGALHRALDSFLLRWPYVCAANMEPFALRTAVWIGLPAAVPPARLAREALAPLGIAVTRESLPAGVWAVWSVEGSAPGRYCIRVSPFLSGPRANFTLWHEWFEVMAARPTFPSRYSGRVLERLADRFAACLTMPAASVARAVREMDGSGDKTDVLAARFGVSRAAMRRRIRDLGLYRGVRTW